MFGLLMPSVFQVCDESIEAFTPAPVIRIRCQVFRLPGTARSLAGRGMHRIDEHRINVPFGIAASLHDGLASVLV